MEQAVRDTIRLLIVGARSEEAEALVNVFRDADFPTRALHIMSDELLDEALNDYHKWDLVLILERTLPKEMTLTTLLEKMEQCGGEIPVVLLADGYQRGHLDMLALGVSAVVPDDASELLLLVSEREIDRVNTRRFYQRMSVALYESEKQRRHLLDDQVDAVAYVADGEITYANRAFNRLLGFGDDGSAVGTPFSRWVAEHERIEVGEFLEHVEESGQALAAMQCTLLCDDGQSTFRITLTPTSFEGRYTLSLQVRLQKDDSEEQSSVQSAGVVEKEPGLFDKTKFREHLDVAMQRLASGKGKFSLVCISLDSLQAVHGKGGKQFSQPYRDELLARLASALVGLRASDWSSEHVMVIFQSDDEKAVSEKVLEVLGQVMKESVQSSGQSLPVKLSAGAVLLDSSSDLDTFIVMAKNSAAAARQQGGGNVRFHKKRKVRTAPPVEKQIAGMVSQALKDNRMKLHYRPVVSLKGSGERHYEACMIMTDVRGRVHESERFRNRIDRNILWSRVDRWQIVEASRAMVRADAVKDGVRLFIHLGGNAFVEKGFLSWMSNSFESAGVSPSSIVVEISEQNMVRFARQASGFFGDAKKRGYLTAVSEFGCSLNPMESVEALAPDYVKVDTSFTRDLTKENHGEELKVMIRKLSELGQKVVVPNVASAVDMAPLWHTGVDLVQGDFIHEPAERMDFNFEEEF